MHRDELVEYLDEKCCVASQFDENPQDDSGRWYVNTLNGIECMIPNDEIVDDIAVIRILVRFKVTIPDDLDDLYNSIAHTLIEEPEE